MIWSVLYLVSVVAVNIAFARWPHLNWLWSIGVGSIFVSRDFCQREIGHYVVLPMLGGLALSYFLASPFVALASACAFAISESLDWIVFTVTKRPLKDRILWSCAVSSPADSAVFLLMIGFFSPIAFAAQVASKMVAALVVWFALASVRPHCRFGMHCWETDLSEEGRLCIAYGGWAEKCSRCGLERSGSNRN